MKSKEEILRNEIGIMPMVDLVDKLPNFFKAMDEYAKEVAMAYFDWGVEQIFPGSIPKHPTGDNGKARENLYKRFIEPQNKPT